jgi:subtilisin-like proprotein convertase family protein
LNLNYSLPKNLASGEEIQINFINDGRYCSINFLEHVQLNIDMEYTRRGNLEIILISAKGFIYSFIFKIFLLFDLFKTNKIGSVTMLLSLRPKDSSVLGFRKWNLTSVHLWGENPRGQWRLIIRDSVNI